jgi:predicted adenylyl cyclase CyaB
MDEIEIKILAIDRKAIEKKLLSLGAKKSFDGEICGIFYDYADERIRNAKDTMRLRKVGSKAFVTYKKFLENKRAKIRREYETEVSDYESARLILESLGLKEWMSMRKHRTTYELPGAHFELDKHTDQYSYVPEFLEIEAKDLRTLYAYVAALGYKKRDCRPWTIVEIAGYYSKKG